MANINDIAKATGFSKSTISRYLNDGSVSDKTKKKIKEAIDKLGYVPNSYARNLKKTKTNIIGIIIPNFIGYTKNTALNSINLFLKDSGYSMLISCSNDDMDEEVRIIEEMQGLNVDGIILFASNITKKHKEVLKDLDTPLVIFGQELDGFSSVIADDYEAGRLMATYIKKLKHKEISYFDVGEYDHAVGKRFKGLSDVLEGSGIKINHHHFDFTKKTAYEKAKEILDREKSTFYLGATDNIAFGIIEALREKNIKIPDDISVAGFGNYEISSITNPSLTTVDFPYDKLGRLAIESLINIIEGNKKEIIRPVKAKLMLRDSSK